MSIKPETLAWLRQTAKFEGGVTAQAILHLLERVEALEAKDQLDAEAWASMRRASCDYQRRLSNLEAAQPAPPVAPAPVGVPVWLSDALIKAECALSDIAEGEETNAAPNSFEWAEQRCAETLAIIRPVMQQHGVRTSEWPPVSQPTAANGSEMPQAAFDADDKVIVHCPKTCWIEIRRIVDGKIIYDNHQKGTLMLPVNESPPAPPAPAGGLVERVAESIAADWARDQPELWHHDARTAIREVAAWLDQRGMHGCSLWLREEAGR